MKSILKYPFITVVIIIFCICGCKKSTDSNRNRLTHLSRQEIATAYTFYIDRNMKAIGLPGIGSYKVDPDKDYLTNKDAALKAYRQSSSTNKAIDYSY